MCLWARKTRPKNLITAILDLTRPLFPPCSSFNLCYFATKLYTHPFYCNDYTCFKVADHSYLTYYLTPSHPVEPLSGNSTGFNMLNISALTLLIIGANKNAPQRHTFSYKQLVMLLVKSDFSHSVYTLVVKSTNDE